MASTPGTDLQPSYKFTGSRSFPQYRKNLICKAKEVTEHEWTCQRVLKGDHKMGHSQYIPLILEKQQSDITASDGTAGPQVSEFSPSEVAVFSPDDLLNGQDERVLLVGPPGIGKTAAVLNSLHHWAENESHCLDYVFYYDTGTLSHISGPLSLKSLLFDKYCHPENDAHEVYQYILQNSDKVAIVFDGATESMKIPEKEDLPSSAEMDVNSLMHSIMVKELLPNAKIIVTCRSESKNFLKTMKGWEKCLALDVKGFSESSIHKFFKSRLENDFADQLRNILGKTELLSLCHVPLYAFMLSASVSFACPELAQLPEKVTEVCVQILCQCTRKHGERHGELGMDLDKYFEDSRDDILSLASTSFDGVMRNTGNLFESTSAGNTRLDRSDFSVLLCSSLQPFWAALWLVEQPEKIPQFLHRCTSNKDKHLKRVVPFLCGLLAGRNAMLLSGLFSGSKITEISNKYFQEAINMLLPSETQSDPDDIVLACQCLHEFQSQEACLHFLKAVQYEVNLSRMHLDPQQCCAVSYVIKQSGERKVSLMMGKSTVSDQGLKLLLHSFPNVQSIRDASLSIRPPSKLSLDLWCTALHSGQEAEVFSLLRLCGNGVHLPATGVCDRDVYVRAGEVMKQSQERIKLWIHWDLGRDTWDECLTKAIVDSLSNIHTISFSDWRGGSSDYFSEIQSHTKGAPAERRREIVVQFLLDLYVKVAERDTVKGENHTILLPSILSFQRFPYARDEANFLLALYGHASEYEAETGRTLSELREVYKHVGVNTWVIDLTKTKALHLLEVLKIQAEKKPVELKDWSNDESDLGDLIQCLPYISKLSFHVSDLDKSKKAEWCLKAIRFLFNLFSQASESTISLQENVPTLLATTCSHSDFPFTDYSNDEASAFLLDLMAYVKNHKSERSKHILPVLKSIFQEAQKEWVVDLSKMSTSLLYDVLQLQGQQKPVQLKGWSESGGEIKALLQCVPYISKLSFTPDGFQKGFSKEKSEGVCDFLLNLFEHVFLDSKTDMQSGKMATLISACSHECFPFPYAPSDRMNEQSEFLLELYSKVKDCQAKTGNPVLPLLQPIYKAAPSSWSVDLSKRDVRLFLEVLNLQMVKKPMILHGWSDAEEDMARIVECLPFISHMSLFDINTRITDQRTFTRIVKFLINLHLQVADHDTQTGENLLCVLPDISRLSMLTHRPTRFRKDRCDFLMHLCRHMLVYEADVGRNVSKALQTVLQLHDDAELVVDLSERRSCTLTTTISHVSILLELLKLQTGKRAVELDGWPTEEIDVQTFLKCLPCISELSLSVTGASEMKIDALSPGGHLKAKFSDARKKGAIRFLIELHLQAAELDVQTGKDNLKLLQSVCISRNFPLHEDFHKKAQSDFLFDLYLTARNVEDETGKHVLILLKYMFQTAPAIWVMDFSDTKASVLLQVFKLQPSKKAVQVRGWTDDESEMTSFLQCLPHISHMSFGQRHFNEVEEKEWEKNMTRFFLKLLIQAEQLETSGGKASKMLVSVCNSSSFPFDVKALIERRKTKEGFLVGLYSCAKDYEGQTKSVLPPLKPILQATPEAWLVDISNRDATNVFEMLKFQTEKKQIVLKGLPGDKSNQQNLLECLPHVSHLSFLRWTSYGDMCADSENAINFLISLCMLAAEDGSQSTQKALSALYRRSKLPFGNGYDRCSFLLDLHLRAKASEAETGRSVLPFLQQIYIAAPRIWHVDMAKQKASNFLEVLKMQTTKVTVELSNWSNEKSELRTFLQCLPFVSQLRIFQGFKREQADAPRFLINLFALASECHTSSEMTSLSAACSYVTFPLDHNRGYEQCAFLLDLFSEAKGYEARTSRPLLPALQSIFQAAPDRWLVDLTKRQASHFLEVLRFQPKKKPVTLCGWPEERQVEDFIQCLPYISKLRMGRYHHGHENPINFLINLFNQAVLTDVENQLHMLQSACKFVSFPMNGFNGESDNVPRASQCGFLLDLYSQATQYQIASGCSVIPALQPVFKVAPELWVVDLAKTKASLLFELLKLQDISKPLELLGWSDDESELRDLLRCLPFISKLKVHHWPHEKQSREKWRKTATFMLNLAIEAVKYTAETGEGTLEKLQSVLSVTEFYHDDYDKTSNNEVQTDFLLSFYSDAKELARDRFTSVLTVLLPVFMAAPRVWVINLSLKKASILLEILKLQSDKRPVHLTGWSEKESDLKTFVTCLPYISQLKCDARFFMAVCKALSVNEAESEKVLAALVEALDFKLAVEGELTDSTCERVGRALGLCDGKGKIDLAPQSISTQGVNVLLENLTRHCVLLFGMDANMTIEAAKWADPVRGHPSPSTVEEMNLSVQDPGAPRSVPVRSITAQSLALCFCDARPSGDSAQPGSVSRALGAVQTLLRCWSIQSLDLQCRKIEGLFLVPLLLSDGSFNIRLCGRSLQQLAMVVYEAQEETLTRTFLEKVSGDLTTCQLDWEVLHHMLLHSTQCIKVDFSYGGLPETRVKDMLPLLERISMTGLSSRLTMAFLRDIFETQDPRCVHTLMKAVGNCLNLDGCVLGPGDCDALLYTLSHVDGLQLGLLWASLSKTSVMEILPMLTRVSQLSMDSGLLLQFIHGAVNSANPQTAGAELLRALHYKLDFSHSSACGRPAKKRTLTEQEEEAEDKEEEEEELNLCLSAADCTAISAVVQFSDHCTDVNLNICHIKDAGLEELFAGFSKVRLSASKTLLVRLLGLISATDMQRAMSLSRAVGRELDLSRTRPGLRGCRALALLLAHAQEDLVMLSLRHCKLTDASVQLLCPHLNRVRVLDLSNNDITDHGAQRILNVVLSSTWVQTIRLYRNRIDDHTEYLSDKRFLLRGHDIPLRMRWASPPRGTLDYLEELVDLEREDELSQAS